MRIVLIGPRGCGKSTAAALLGQKLSCPVFSTDRQIEQTAQMPIGTLVDQRGWNAFRDLEQQVVESLGEVDPAIIDTGGGAIERPANRRALCTNALVVYLTGTAKVLAARIFGDVNRPALTDQADPVDEMHQVLARRDPIYREMAALIIDTDDKNPEQIATQILEAATKGQTQI